MRKSTKFSPEVRERAVRIVAEQRGEHESQWAAIVPIAVKIGAATCSWRRPLLVSKAIQNGGGTPPHLLAPTLTLEQVHSPREIARGMDTGVAGAQFLRLAQGDTGRSSRPRAVARCRGDPRWRLIGLE